jgi:hypothetical protein
MAYLDSHVCGWLDGQSHGLPRDCPDAVSVSVGRIVV